MGFEEFVDIACRLGELEPAAVVLVASVKALSHHGDGSLDEGAANLARHVELVLRLGWEPVVAVNAYADDSLFDLNRVRELALAAGARDAEIADGVPPRRRGHTRARRRRARARRPGLAGRALYRLDTPIEEKLERSPGARTAPKTSSSRRRR